MSSQSELLPGTVFARDFRIVRHLADGGMGAVYVVEQLSTAKQRALKVMHPHLARELKHRTRFESEARISGRIESDHVVEVLAAGVDDTTSMPWLAMELLRGETLDQTIERTGPLTIDRTREVAKQLRHVLEHAHAHSLVHRDLKPENVFLAVPRREDVAFTVKVLDFGIAKWVQEARDAMKNSQIIGSPMWMAPEQLTPGTDITPATDVWALGLIFFYLLTGRSYWVTANSETASISALLVELAINPMPPASERAASLGASGLIPEGFDAWFARTATREPADRLQDGGRAMAELVTILGRGQPQASLVMVSPVAPPSEPPPRNTLDNALAALGNTSDEAEMALRLARVYELRDSDRDRAIAAYERVLSVLPASTDALRGLAGLYRRAGEWSQLETMLCLELERVSLGAVERRERLLEVARVREEHLANLAGAAEALTRAVEGDQAGTKAVEALASFLARHGSLADAARLVEEAARAAGSRGDGETHFRLLVRAADLHGEASGQEDAALGALDQAAALRTDAVEVRARRASLYARGSRADPMETRRQYRSVLAIDPAHADTLRALFELTLAHGTKDEAWVIADAACAILVERAPAAMRAFRDENASRSSSPLSRLDDAAWTTLGAPELAARFARALPELQKAHAKPLAQAGLSIKELVDPATSSRALLQLAMPLYRAILAVAPAFDLASMPQFYLRASDPPGVRHLATVPAASLAGGALPDRAWSAAELAFLAGEHAAYYRPELNARVLLTSEAMCAAMPDVDASAIRDARRACELAACRAGLLACGDLSAARHVLETVVSVVDPLPANERFRDLAAFAISDGYASLRRATGRAISA